MAVQHTAPLSLPPIARGSVFSESDSRFVEERLRTLKKVKADSSPAQCVDVEGDLLKEAQLVFDEAIERLPASGKILAKIKREYDAVIQGAVESRREADMLPHRQVWRTSKELTVRNYRMRVRELQDKLVKLKADNIRIKNEIEEIRREREAAAISVERRLKEQQQHGTGHRLSGSTRRSLGLSLRQATSITLLKREVERLREEFAEAKEVTEKKYVPLHKKLHLQQQLKEREEFRGRLVAENKALASRLRRLKMAAQATGSYRAAIAKRELDPEAVTLDEYISSAIVGQDPVEEVSDDDAEDPGKEMEQEMILDCFEKFNELFEVGRYEEAALHAASSPRGVLRTLDTLHKFKRSARHQPGRSFPLLLYCQALMQSEAAYRPPSLQEGLECAQCALEQGEISKLTHWIAQGSLPPCVELGTVIFRNCRCNNRCQCGCKNLACTVFERCGAHQQVSLCLVHQGKFVSFLAYAKKMRLATNDYAQLLYSCPSAEFADSLVFPPPPYSASLTTFEALHILLRAGLKSEAINFLTSSLRDQSLTEAVINDEKTDWHVWQSLIECLQKEKLWEWALEFVSILAVKLSLLKAMAVVQQEWKEEEEEEARKKALQQQQKLYLSDHESYDGDGSLSGSYQSSAVAGTDTSSGSGYSSSSEESDDEYLSSAEEQD